MHDTEVETSPPRLIVRFREPSKHDYTIETVSLPVPADRLDEAAWVADAIRAGAGVTRPTTDRAE